MGELCVFYRASVFPVWGWGRSLWACVIGVGTLICGAGMLWSSIGGLAERVSFGIVGGVFVFGRYFP